MCKKLSVSKIKYEEVKRLKREEKEAERITILVFSEIIRINKNEHM